MTVNKTTNIINKAYGYKIIKEKEEAALKSEREVILSELGIGAIFEFLSYDVAEFAEIRKTIHARRFYQLYKEIFNFSEFDLESFHKMQAGCIFIVVLAGITRGIDDYEYSGFVLEALAKTGKINPENTGVSLNEKLFYIKSSFEQFSRVSLGIYSLQIFTKYGLVMKKINKDTEGLAGRQLIETIDDINKGKNVSEKIDRLLSMEIISPRILEKMIDEYIEYAVEDMFVQGISPGSKKAEKANKKLIADISEEVNEALSGLKIDIADLYNLNKEMQEDKNVFEREQGKPGIDTLFSSLLKSYVNHYERLWYYLGNSFIKRLNMIFITRVKEMFAEQRKQEMTVVKNECIRIIEEGLSGVRVFELEGVFDALDRGKKEFDLMHGLNPADSKEVIDELLYFLDTNISTARSIQYEMKTNLGRLLSIKGIPAGELKIFQDIVYDFDAIMELFSEDKE